MKITNFLILAGLLVNTTFANAIDVQPKFFVNGSRYIRVTDFKVNGRKKVTFEDCIKNDEIRSCKIIGPMKSYPLEKLIDQRDIERLQVAGSIVSDAAIAVLGFIGGYYIAAGASVISGSAVVTTGVTPSLGSGLLQIGNYTVSVVAGRNAVVNPIIVGGTVGGAIGVPIVGGHWYDALNPNEQYQQAHTLQNDVIYDQLVKVDQIDMFISRLAGVLEKIK